MKKQHLKNRLKEVEINAQAPFAHDALSRQKSAEILTSVVDVYGQSGCVMALNGEWGSGKTTFVKMWQVYMENLNYKTIYFNAWESDYMKDPLVAFVSELQVLNTDKSKALKVAASIGRIILAVSSSIVKNICGVGSDAIKAGIDEVTAIGIQCLKEYSEDKATLSDFKKNLVEYIASSSNGKPVVFFVDELDRCRPDYAVKILERIKHLFDIPNIIFVLSINKRELSHAIQGFYGSDNIDANNYLRRFIDIEYELPTPNMQDFTKYLYNEYDFDNFLRSKARLQYRMGDESSEFLITATQFAEICQLDLRTQDRIFALCRITLQAMSPGNYLLANVLYVLCLLKVKFSDVYAGIRAKSFTLQALISTLEDSILNNYKVDNTYDRRIEFTIGILIFNYNVADFGNVVDPNFVGTKSDEADKMIFPFTVTKLNKERLNDALNWCMNNPLQKYHLGLSFTINRIDLLNPLQNFNLE